MPCPQYKLWEEKENTVAVAVTADATDTAAVNELSTDELWIQIKYYCLLGYIKMRQSRAMIFPGLFLYSK